MINESEVQQLDNKFNTKSKVFQATDTIIISTPLDDWKIVILEKKYKNVILYHKNRTKCTKKYHRQGLRSNLFQAYDSIYNHKGVLKQIYSQNTYKYKNKK